MKSLLLFYAKNIEEEKLLSDLEDAIKEYKLFPDDKEKKMHLTFQCMIAATRFGTENIDTFDLIKRFDKHEKILSAFDKKEN